MNTPEQIVEKLKNMPRQRVLPGVITVTIRERPMVKLMAQLAEQWNNLQNDVITIKEISKTQEGSVTISCLFDVIPDVGGSWILTDATAKDGQLVDVMAVVILAEEGYEAVGQAFATGLIQSLIDAAKAKPGAISLDEQRRA